MSVQISVSDELKKTLDTMAKEKGCSIGEATEHMVGIAVNRLNALRTYAEKQGGKGKIAKPKKAAKKAAKPSVAKAKAPKVKKAKAEPAPEAPAAEA
jgi:hypothetical protein